MQHKQVLLVYDRECPVGHNNCQAVHIRAAAGELQIVNARERSDILQEITDRGLDIDQGMVLKLDDQFYYGAEFRCIH